MIVIDHQQGLVNVAVFGEFTLADYKEFEEVVNYKVKFEGPVDLFYDLSQMAGLTVDVAWEDLKFSRAHANDFKRIAVPNQDVAERQSRHDFQIALHRHPVRTQAEFSKHLGDAGAGPDQPRFAVDPDRKGFGYVHRQAK